MNLHISRKKIVDLSRNLSKEQMHIFLQTYTGERFTSSEFEKAMRELLPKEQFFQTDVIRTLKEVFPDVFVWKAAAGVYSRQGIPDVCCIIEGHFFAFEIKRPYIGELSPIQARTIEEINKAGGTAVVVSFGHQAIREVYKWQKEHQ